MDVAVEFHSIKSEVRIYVVGGAFFSDDDSWRSFVPEAPLGTHWPFFFFHSSMSLMSFNPVILVSAKGNPN